MKIQELHLRNIASIEKADIDFENGLKDEITGNDANIFLICGDTGAGKSVILDGISMALYKNTPRIAGVVNTKKNEFKDAEGESIRIGSIEQYTRLGISDKDECYSEVAFVGNDGVNYRVKLSLGITKSNKKDASGKYLFHHSTPKWEMKIGTNGWEKTDESVIQKAVGLTFQQFGRMAMLAQGQFAAFLTGDKKEREAILEQLTNTEHFTAYGKAIESLYKKAKSDKETLEIQHNTESDHTLPKEKVKELTDQKAELENKKADLDQRDKDNDKFLEQVNIIETNRSTADRENTERKKYNEIVKGDEYKSKKALVTGWDDTSTERQILSDLKDALQKLDKAKADEAKQKENFAILSADLQARRKDLEAQGNPKNKVDEKQTKIDKLERKRMALNPEEVNNALSSLSDYKLKLDNIATRAFNIKADETAAKLLEGEIAQDENQDKKNAVVYANKEKACTTASAKKDEAQKRLLTMQSGVEDTMIALRKRLADEHTEVCPLCGQRIVEIHLDDEIRQIVTPLEEEFNTAKKQYDEAKKSLDAAKEKRDTFSGALKHKKKDLERKKSDITKAKNALSTDASKFGFDITQPLPEQIAIVQKALLKRETKLKADQEKAESLQTQINNLQKEKNSLDEALREYNDDYAKLKNIEKISDQVVELHPDWETGVEAQPFTCDDILSEWNVLLKNVSSNDTICTNQAEIITECKDVLDKYYNETGKTEEDLADIEARKDELQTAREYVKKIDNELQQHSIAAETAEKAIKDALSNLSLKNEKDAPQKQTLLDTKKALKKENDDIVGQINIIQTQLDENTKNAKRLAEIEKELNKAKDNFNKWDILNSHFGGTRFRTLVQTYILRPLLNNANIYLEKITDRYSLTCSEDNEQLAILVQDRYNKNQIRSVTILSGGERFMISLALSLALSSLNRPDMNVNILFIDEGFGTLDEKILDSVMETLEKLQEIAGQSGRRVGIISHREELLERILVQILLRKRGEGRSELVFRGTKKDSLQNQSDEQ